MDITKWAMLFSFDVMGEVGFSTDFQSLEKGEEHDATKPLHEAMGLAYNVGATMPWLLCIIVRIPGASGPMEKFAKLCAHQLDEKKKVNKQLDVSTLSQGLVDNMLMPLPSAVV